MKSTKNKLPMTITLKRRSIRNYPGGVVVGVYYSDDLDKTFAITSQKDVEEVNFNEDVEGEFQ